MTIIKEQGIEEIKKHLENFSEMAKGIDTILVSYLEKLTVESRLRKQAEEELRVIRETSTLLTAEARQARREKEALERKVSELNSEKLEAYNKLQKSSKELKEEKITRKMLEVLIKELAQIATKNENEEILRLLHPHKLINKKVKEDIKLMAEGLPNFSEHNKKAIIYHSAFLSDFETLNIRLQKATINAILKLAMEGPEHNSLNSKILHRATKNTQAPPWCSYINKKWRFTWESINSHITIVEILERKEAYDKRNV